MISFVIPAYNAEKTIKRAIDSCINQKDKSLEYEIVVVNDGSTDNTEYVISQNYVMLYEKNIDDDYIEKEVYYVGNRS